MKKILACVSSLLLGCGAAKAPPAHAPEPASVMTTTAAAKATPAPFTGSFDIVSMTDGKTTTVVEDLMKKNGAIGRMTWEFGADSFAVGLWQLASPEHLADGDGDLLYSFCRATGTVSAHWEDMTLVLASTVRAQGASSAIRAVKKVEGAKTTRRTTESSAQCAASFAGTRIAFTITDKDADGPTHLHAKAEGVELELTRGRAPASIEPRTLLEGAK